ncbi:pro-neuregulin-4, membrane-bound isoform [Rhinoraja longicauda]
METPAHGELCPDSYNSYCFNGGTCYILISTPFCWCNDSFKGNRCQEFLLLSQQPERTVGSSWLVIVIAVTLLIVLLVVTGRTYCYCRKQRLKRMKEQGRSVYHVVARHRSIDIEETFAARKHEPNKQ